MARPRWLRRGKVQGLVLVGVIGSSVVPALLLARQSAPAEAFIAAPADVRELLGRACNDCHSHETRVPWYAWVPPTSWLVASDVYRAQRHLNLSKWQTRSLRRRFRRVQRLYDVLEGGDWKAHAFGPLPATMPPKRYLALHREARLSPTERSRLIRWAYDERARLGPWAEERDQRAAR